MYETVSVEEAITRGRRKLAYGTALIIFGGIIVSYALPYIFKIPFYFIGVGWLVSYALGIIFAFASIPKWRIWALENVRNVHELYDRTRLEMLIPKENSWLNRLQIISKADKERLMALNQKFLQPDIFIDDPLLPAELIIYRSSKSLIEAGILLLIFGLSVCTVFFLGLDESNFSGYLGSLLLAASCFLLYKGISRKRNKIVRLTISDIGIQDVESSLIPWETIGNAGIRIVRGGKSRKVYFDYAVGKSTHAVDLETLSIKWRDLDHAIRIYRGRYEQKKISAPSSINSTNQLFNKSTNL